jgi:VIT1/CCC1 family predicted Fe2+/Mn2+ transporter
VDPYRERSDAPPESSDLSWLEADREEANERKGRAERSLRASRDRARGRFLVLGVVIPVGAYAVLSTMVQGSAAALFAVMLAVAWFTLLRPRY